MKKVAVIFLKETLIQMIISTVLLALIAFVVLKISPSVATIKIMVLIIYGIASFCGGVIVGKVMESRKFVWGALAGLIYFAIIFLTALISKGSVSSGSVGLFSGCMVSVVAGTIGGMLS